jgi:PPP family 3-phenylpropionic acid transporter
MNAALRLAAYYFAYFAYVGAFMPYFPLYLASRGLGAVEISLVVSLPQWARVFAPALWGWLADRSGAPRGIVVFSSLAVALGWCVLPFAEGASAIAATVATMSVLSAGGMPLLEAIALSIAARTRGGYGPIRLWGSVGFIVAVTAVGAWLDWRPPRDLSVLLPVFALVTLIVSFAVPSGERNVSADGTRRGAAPGAGLRALLAAGFCMAVAHGALYAFYTLYLRERGYSGTTIGALWTLGVVAEIGVFLYLRVLLRRFALSAILLASFIAAGLRFAAIGALGGSLAVLVIAQLLHAMTFGAHHAASVAAVQRLVPEAARARGQALYASLSYGAGGAVGAVLAGWTWDAVGHGQAFVFSAVAGLTGALFVPRLRRAGI